VPDSPDGRGRRQTHAGPRRRVNTMTQSASDLPLFPMARAVGCPFDPPPELRALAAKTKITKVRLWDGSTPWLITRFSDQQALLSDPRLSADSNNPGYPDRSAGHRARKNDVRIMSGMDDPEHSRLRRMVTALMADKQIGTPRPAIQKIVDDLIDDMLAGPKPVDLVQAFALPVPTLVTCELLGVPYTDRSFFQRNAKCLVDRGVPAERAQAAQDTLIDYLERLIFLKAKAPGDDLLSRLLVDRVATGELTQHEVTVIGAHLLVAGFETTGSMIALGTLALLENPDQLAMLRDTEDSRLVSGAVEELLRYLTVAHSGRRRVATAPIEISGEVIRAGDGVVFPADVANRDDSVFEDPDRLDIRRKVRGHLAFGSGAHKCLGRSLARLQLRVVYSTLYRRIPTLRLAVDSSQLRFKHDGTQYGVHELPVTW
jgi:cytochrome P450